MAPLLTTSFFIGGCAVAALAGPCPLLPFPPSNDDVMTFINITFDFLIVGGGTAGVALAARLAERTQLSVGIVEAGAFHLDDPLVDVPRFVGQAVQNPNYDWNFLSTSEPNTAGRNFSIPRGKMLGGSSGINGMAWNRASSSEYDAWGEFSSDDWTWKALLPYFKHAESLNLHPSDPYPGVSDAERQHVLQDLPRVAGFDGPIQASHNVLYPDPVFSVAESLNKMGVRTNPEAQGGDATGLYNTYATVDRRTGTRSYSPKGYLCDGRVRSNLHILTGAQATRIVFDSALVPLRATGVEVTVEGVSYHVNAQHEVILAAGAVQSPHLLELSGIGNSTRLAQVGISVLIDLPSVGENLQEHLYVGVQWQLKPGHFTWDVLNSNMTLSQEQLTIYNRTRTGLYTDLDSTVLFLPPQGLVDTDRLATLLALFDADSSNVSQSTIQSLQYPVLRAMFEEGAGAITQIIQWSYGISDVMPNTSYINVLGCITRPMSRGSVHISSSDALHAPTIRLGYLRKVFDAEVLLDVLKYIISIGQQEPFASIVAEQNVPSPSVQRDDELLDYIRQTSSGGDHLIGTAAMAPRDRGGVVDASLRVYGTSNLRVVDASMIPLHISCNPQATVYAIAEKMAVSISSEYV